MDKVDKAEEALKMASRASQAEPPDLARLINSIELFSQAGELNPTQKQILEQVVEGAVRTYLPLTLRDQTFTDHAIFAYETLFRAGKFNYDNVGPENTAELDKILVLSVLYFRRVEQLKEQAGKLRKQGAGKEAEALVERKNRLYNLGNLDAQIYFGKQIGSMQSFSDVEAAISRMDKKERFPGFREILVTDYVLKHLQIAYNLQRIGQVP